MSRIGSPGAGSTRRAGFSVASVGRRCGRWFEARELRLRRQQSIRVAVPTPAGSPATARAHAHHECSWQASSAAVGTATKEDPSVTRMRHGQDWPKLTAAARAPQGYPTPRGTDQSRGKCLEDAAEPGDPSRPAAAWGRGRLRFVVDPRLRGGAGVTRSAPLCGGADGRRACFGFRAAVADWTSWRTGSVNGQVLVPAGGHEKVPTPPGWISWV